jgi:hypothetical protein
MDDEKHDQFYLNRQMLGTALRAEEVASRERDFADGMRRLDPATRQVEDTWMSGGGVMVLLGGLILLLDAFGRELLILSWLGDLQKPIGIALVVFGLAIIAIRFVQGVPLSVLLRSKARSTNKSAAPTPAEPASNPTESAPPAA